MAGPPSPHRPVEGLQALPSPATVVIDAALDLAHPVVLEVGDQQVTLGIERDRDRGVQGRFGRGATVATGSAGGGRVRARRAVADDRPDLARRDFSHPLVVSIGDEQIARLVDRDPTRAVEGRGLGRAAVAARGGAGGVAAVRAGAGDGGDHAARGDLADPVIAGVGDEDVALGVDRHALGVFQAGLGGGAAVAADGRPGGVAAVRAGAGDGGDDAARGDLAHAAVERVGDEHVALRIDGDGVGIVEGRVDR